MTAAVDLSCVTSYLTGTTDYLSVTDWTSALPFAVDGNTEAVEVGSGRSKSGAQSQAKFSEPRGCSIRVVKVHWFWGRGQRRQGGQECLCRVPECS